MSHTVIVFVEGAAQRQVQQQVERVLEQYPAFVLVEATDEQVAALREQGYVVEERKAPSPPPVAIAAPAPRVAPGRHHFLVTFIGPVRPEWLRALEDVGCVMRQPMPPYGYVVELDTDQISDLLAKPYISDITWYNPLSRITPDAVSASRPPAAPAPAPPTPGEAPPRPSLEVHSQVVRVRFFTREQKQEALSQLAAQGVEVEPLEEEADTDIIVRLPEDSAEATRMLQEVSLIHGVQDILPVIRPETANDVAARLTGVEEVRANPNFFPLTGEGETVAITDTGLDSGQPDHLHPDLRGRVAGISSWPVSRVYSYQVRNVGADDGPADQSSGHGTHVAGTVAGSGDAAAERGLSRISGMAPGARIFFQAIEQKTEYRDGRVAFHLTGLPADARLLYQQAYDAGARIHNLSLRVGLPGLYTSFCEQTDEFVWTHPDMVIVAAVGNEGRDRDRDGKVDAGSVTSPGTAKNVISVGAAESQRSGIGYTLPWGRLWPMDYPSPPLRDDHPSNDPLHIAAFSGRGPTADGRIKPDLVAPGTNIVSTRSQVLSPQEVGWGRYPDLPEFYMVNGGTSMATPVVAGAAALVREYLRRVERRRPSAALVKAMLIHAAQYRPNPLNPGDGPYDHEQGWGHLELNTVLHPEPPRRVRTYERQRGLDTGEYITRWADVQDSSVPLKVTLVWTDAPGSPRMVQQLVNDLDLIVIAPDGTRYHGNQFTPPYNQAFDRLNNVEQVIIPNPIVGRYLLRVRATNVPRGPQGFALVWSAAMP